MISLNIEVKGLDDLKKAFSQSPMIVKKYINDAISNSMFLIENNASDDNFDFKTPRSQRTGWLQRSFKFGILTKDFFGSIGPIAEYAPMVHRDNPFMDRIARQSQPAIQREFEYAVNKIAEEISRIAK